MRQDDDHAASPAFPAVLPVAVSGVRASSPDGATEAAAPPAQAKAAQAKPEPAKPEPAKSAPAKPEPVKPEPPRAAGRRRDRAPLPVVMAACAALLLITMVAGVGLGSVGLSPAAVLHVVSEQLSGHPDNTVAGIIVWQIRLPRVLLAAVVGAALTTAGVVVQVLVRNALADPFLLGVSSGASVGATAVLLLGAFASLGVWAISVGSVLGALVAMAVVFGVSQSGRGLAPTQLILCGVVLSAMFESVTSFLIFRGNPQATQSVLFWLLGSFGLASWNQLPIPALALVAVMAYLLAQGRSLNALAMGAEPAAALGIDVQQLRRNLFFAASLLAGVSVAVSGVIGFVGLVVPHIVRLIVGSDHRRVLPVGVLFGASFMVLGDLLARTIVAPQEMPMGVITAFIGAPTLLILIRRRPYLYGATQ
jgi:iron complex transport system permease protein